MPLTVCAPVPLKVTVPAVAIIGLLTDTILPAICKLPPLAMVNTPVPVIVTLFTTLVSLITGLLAVVGMVTLVADVGILGHQFEGSFQIVVTPNQVLAGLKVTTTALVAEVHEPPVLELI